MYYELILSKWVHKIFFGKIFGNIALLFTSTNCFQCWTGSPALPQRPWWHLSPSCCCCWGHVWNRCPAVAMLMSIAHVTTAPHLNHVLIYVLKYVGLLSWPPLWPKESCPWSQQSDDSALSHPWNSRLQWPQDGRASPDPLIGELASGIGKADPTPYHTCGRDGSTHHLR